MYHISSQIYKSSMNHKKELQVKSVHRFTQNANMKFRPTYYTLPQQTTQTNSSMVGKVSQILGNFFANRFKPSPSTNAASKNKTYTKSAIVQPSPSKNKSLGSSRKNSTIQGENSESPSRHEQEQEVKTMSKMQTNFDSWRQDGDNSLVYLQKITSETFLIGNQNQLDLITISGIYDNVIDTDINWSLNLHKKIKKLSVDIKKCLLAFQCQEQILIYSFDIKRLKTQPSFVTKTKLLGQPKFMIFLKDSQLGVFYQTSATIYQIQESNAIRIIFNKKYGVAEGLKLFQIPKPIDSTLNIFFIEKSPTSKTYILWRLELQFKVITLNHSFKSIVRIYDIPSGLVNKFKIDNFSRDIMILNFKFEILAAKDGFIIDAANTNIQEDGSCLVYQGDHLLHVSQSKLFIYGFKILTNVKPNKIELRSLDSIEINKDPRYSFFDCLEMFNGNFVLFFQVKPQHNNKLKGEIDYMITVTQKLSIQEKLNEIFAFKTPQELKEMTETNFQRIQEKCDMAFKIGLSRKQVYLQLWNKSNKKQISDYKFLLDTMDYETIKEEIQKKLKKASMPFNEVYKIQQACFQMLRADLFSNSNCNQKAIKNYLISHFLLRKLIYFKYTNLQNPACMKNATVVNQKGQEENARIFVIDIQQYVQTVTFELKSHFVEYVSKLCFEDKPVDEHLRIFLREFRFPLRVMYTQLLETLIVHAKNRLINFLKIIPEILPYDSLELSMQDMSLYMGLWTNIETEEWAKNLHIQEISTIYNKDYVQELTKTVWFKRNQNTMHDLVALSKQKIIEIQQFNQSDGIFYFFIEKIFQYSKDQLHLQQVVDFMENKYARLPAHLKGKIFLYKKLFNYFASEKQNHSEIASFNSFLKLKDHELFKELFRYEKIKKGCLLKDAKKIYESINNGIELYHQGLLNYFASDLSQISDLKYILNRLNNQKREFHIQNQGIYVVLVRAMQMKLKLGSDNDIPLDQVMIYVQNIPLSKNNPVIEDLKTVERINEESERFKKMKLNMSLLQIIENCEDVVTALINEEIKEKGVLNITDQQELIDVSYGILAQVQTIKDKIYKGKYSDLPYFIYLSKLLEVKEQISSVNILLQDKYLLEYYCVDQRLIQNLVLYMYKWKFNQQPTFIKNQDYLQALLTLLPANSECRSYIQSQIQFAIMLSTPNYLIQYPLTQSDTISMQQIAIIINNHTAEDINRLDIVKLHEVVQRMQELCVEMEITSIQEIYEICIMRLIGLNNIRDAIPMIRKLVELYGMQENYSIIFAYFVLFAILDEMPDVHKKLLMRISFYTFNHPLQLLDIIQARINVKLSNEEELAFLQGELDKVKHNPCFNFNSQLIDPQIKAKLQQNHDKYYHKIEDLIFQTWTHLNNSRQDFQRNHEYTFYYIMLLHNPYALAKYLAINQGNTNIRLLRSFLSYVFKEDIFHGPNVLYFGRRVFMIVLESANSLMPVEVVASQFKGNELAHDQMPIEIEEHVYDSASFPGKIHKSIETFNKKINSFKEPKADQTTKKKKRVEALLSSQASIRDLEVSEYPFNDSDDNYEDLEEDESRKKVEVKHKKRGDRHFDANRERKIIMEREGKNLALYLSSAGGEDQLIRRTSPKMLKSSKTFQNAFQSVNVPNKNRKVRKVSDSINHVLDHIERSDSLRVKDDYDQPYGLATSQSQDQLFKSSQPLFLQPQLDKQENAFMYKSYSPEKSKVDEVDSPANSPMRLMNKNSIVQLDIQDEQQNNAEYAFKVTEIDDQQYTPVQALKKQLLCDIGSETDPIFDLSLIAKQEQKQFQNFNDYLRDLITCIYSERSISLIVLLQLIKQIKNAYPQAGISSEFLQYYIALENYNIKYKSQYLIREMFPISGVFLQSSNPIVLFQYVKNNILDIASYDRIVVIAQLLTTVLRKHEIKDDLYLSYLAREIEIYGNDSSSSQMELKMQRERIEGMLPQITTSTLFLQRGEAILRPISSPSRRAQVSEMIKQALRKKKKDYLIREFQKKISTLNA